MAVAPRANKIGGPAAIRHLLGASEVYQRVVKDTVGMIRDAIDEGQLVEKELAYARLMMALMAVERDLSWTAEECRVLLGEKEAGS